MAQRNRLTSIGVQKAGPGMHHDGHGLYLRVDPSGSRRWVQRLTVNGRRRNLGLGGYPTVSLAEAREKAHKNRLTVQAWGDPLAEKRAAEREASMPTFAETAKQYIAFQEPQWSNAKHVYQWKRTLEAYANPIIGDMPVDEVASGDVLAVLTPIWFTKTETARRVRQRIRAVMGWAMAQNYRNDNPAADAIMAVMPKLSKTKHHQRAIHYSKVAEAIRAVHGSDAATVTKLSFEYTVLTAARIGQVRKARWPEINEGAQIWTAPAEHMKARQAFRVPLSDRAQSVLDEARPLTNGNGLIFSATSAGERLISDSTHSKLLRKLGVDAVPHGFRSSFRDWAAECTDTPYAVMETALAHSPGDATVAAYARSDLLDRRRPLMAQWADYLGESG